MRFVDFGLTSRSVSLNVPDWAPAAGEIATLTVANGGLSNSFGSVVPSHLAQFWSSEVVNAYSGSVVNPHLGDYGSTLFNGAGHASGGNDNSVYALLFGKSSAEWRRLTTQVDLFPLDGIANQGLSSNHAISTDWGEWSAAPTPEEQPADRHSYADFAVLGPSSGGATYGTLYSVQPSSLGQQGYVLDPKVAHKVAISSQSAAASAWARGGADSNSQTPAGVVFSELVGTRIYTECTGSTLWGGSPGFTRWYDTETESYVIGTGTGLTKSAHSTDGGALIHIPSRNLLVYLGAAGGTLSIRSMDVSVSQPSWNNTARTLSNSISVRASSPGWSCACWCSHNERIIVGDVNGDANCVYEIEIPADLNETWTCTRVGFAEGQTIAWQTSGGGTSYKKWSYNEATRTINYLLFVPKSGTTETVYVYRPRNT